MFFDNMVTRKICDIIERGASTRLSDKAFLEKEIAEWLTSRARMNQIEGDGDNTPKIRGYFAEATLDCRGKWSACATN